MAIEIERKWLLRREAGPAILRAFDSAESITQAYVVTGDREVRVRLIERVIGESECRLTIKVGKGISRTEVEVPLMRHDADTLIRVAKGSLKKVRYHVGRWEIDDFLTPELHGLVMMEIELTSEDEPLPPFPLGIEEHIVREVTDDPRYKNQKLAQSGIPSEDDPEGKAHMAERT